LFADDPGRGERFVVEDASQLEEKTNAARCCT
jgi:hypothetical protein